MGSRVGHFLEASVLFNSAECYEDAKGIKDSPTCTHVHTCARTSTSTCSVVRPPVLQTPQGHSGLLLWEASIAQGAMQPAAGSPWKWQVRPRLPLEVGFREEVDTHC